MNQYTNTSLIRLEGVTDKVDVPYYLGKKLAYVYKARCCCCLRLGPRPRLGLFLQKEAR